VLVGWGQAAIGGGQWIGLVKAAGNGEKNSRLI